MMKENRVVSGAFIALCFLAVFVTSCDFSEPVSNDKTTVNQKTQPLQERAQCLYHLSHESSWVALNNLFDAPYLVSPLYSPDGRWIAASGKGGVGLYIIDVEDPGNVLTVEPDYMGPRGWSREPVALHFGHEEVNAFVVTKAKLTHGQKVWIRPWREDLGQQIHQSSFGTWYHHPRLGTISLQRTGATLKVIVSEKAWGVKVSPDGERVVWSTGTLSQSQMFILDTQSEKKQSLGQGVHPCWLPNGRSLLFARPSRVAGFNGRGYVDESELMIHDVASNKTRSLTSTKQKVEMQPVVSPDGNAVVFADWRKGILYRARIEERQGGTL